VNSSLSILPDQSEGCTLLHCSICCACLRRAVAPGSSIYTSLHWYRHRTIYYVGTDNRLHRLARGNIPKLIGAHRRYYMYRTHTTCDEVSANASFEAPVCMNIYTDLCVTLDACAFLVCCACGHCPFCVAVPQVVV